MEKSLKLETVYNQYYLKGGLLCKNIGNGRRYRRRTPGGTFLYLAAYGMIVEDEEKNEWRKSFFAEHKAEFIQDSDFLLVILIQVY